MISALPARSKAVLREMGLGPLWRLRSRDAELTEPAVEGEAGEVAEVRTRAALVPSRAGSATAVRDAPAPRVQALPRAPLPSAPQPAPRPAQAPADPERAARIATLDWTALEADIHACRACTLCEKRTQAVPGVGDRKARWMLVGEGPGAEEDRRGEPFVGPAGILLDSMLGAIGLQRGDGVYIANAVKCRPPHNRTPEAAEIGACLPYLRRQIALVRPQLLVALGRPAAQALLGAELSISAARGKRFDYEGTPVVVTYHPAYLLRNPQDKAKAWEDLCFARRQAQAAPER